MTDTGRSDEPLQQLPQGLPRRYAEYKPASAVPATPPTNVGGYDDLLAHFRAVGKELPRSKEGIAAVDELMDGHPDRAVLAKLVRAIGMFYGDVLTHTIPGAHWIEEDSPCVQVNRTTAVAVVFVAERRLTIGIPTLIQNYAHVLEMVTSQT
jgi:hypothetical protein